MLLLFSFVISLNGCSKNDSSSEIKVKKNNLSGTNEKNSEEEKNNSGKSGSGKNSSSQLITSKEVRQHIGDSLTIRGYVADIYLGEKVAYLNFEDKFPKNVFACAVFSGKFNEFGDLSKYKGKNVEVRGKISTYKNRPQVILNSKDQIKIIQ